MNKPLPEINNSWTLFLDRDGVINVEKHNDYVYNYEEFHFYEGVPEAIASFSALFSRIIIVTNQRGIGKGFMTADDLQDIHEQMLRDIEAAGGRIDAIYFCASLEDDHPDRKPNTGMAQQAKNDFPEIDFEQSIMVGNNFSDMAFGKNAGMVTAFIRSTQPNAPLNHPQVDYWYTDLKELAFSLLKS